MSLFKEFNWFALFVGAMIATVTDVIEKNYPSTHPFFSYLWGAAVLITIVLLIRLFIESRGNK